MMARGTDPRQRIVGGAICCAIAIFIAYVVWSGNPGLNTPPAIAYTAAGIFGAAGIALFLQAYGRERGSVLVVAVLLGAMAVAAGWIALGPGTRECMGAIGFFSFGSGQLACRGVFALSAILTGGIAVMAARSLRR